MRHESASGMSIDGAVKESGRKIWSASIFKYDVVRDRGGSLRAVILLIASRGMCAQPTTPFC